MNAREQEVTAREWIWVAESKNLFSPECIRIIVAIAYYAALHANICVYVCVGSHPGPTHLGGI